jgi:hypothetical protein
VAVLGSAGGRTAAGNCVCVQGAALGGWPMISKLQTGFPHSFTGLRLPEPHRALCGTVGSLINVNIPGLSRCP